MFRFQENPILQNPYASPKSMSDRIGTELPKSLLGVKWTIAGYIACTLPLINYVFVLLFWMLASCLLGEWVKPGLHDPQNFLLGIPNFLSFGLMLMSFAILPMVIGFGLARRKVGFYLVSYAFCLLASIILFRLNFFNTTDWIMD